MTERYYAGKLPEDLRDLLTLDAEESHHLIRVMRGKPGQAIVLFSAGRVFEAKFHSTAGKSALTEITSELPPPPRTSFHMTFMIPWLKGGRSETVIQKLTELGASNILIYGAQRAVAQLEASKLERLQRVALEACKQCERADPPQIEMSSSLMAGLQLVSLPKERCLLLAERFVEGIRLSAAISALIPNATKFESNDYRLGSLLIISGPEGGFSEAERSQTSGLVTGVTLGPRILRAETAPLVAAAVALTVAGDL